MRICIVCTAFSPSTVYGGPATVALGHARALAQRGHKVTVLTSDLLSFNPPRRVPSDTAQEGIEVHYFPGYWPVPRFPFLTAPALVQWMRQHLHEYDAVHVHFAREWIPFQAASVALALGVPLYLQPHGMLNRRGSVRSLLDKLFFRRLLDGATNVLALQKHEAGALSEIAPGARLNMLPNGIQLTDSMPRWRAAALADRTVLFLARLHPRKRVVHLIEAARLLRESGLQVRYRIVGPDGGDLGTAKHLVERYQLADAVEFVGPVAHELALQEMAEASVYVLPSVDEPFPMSVLEALAVGVPTVVTKGIHILDMLESSGAAEIADPSPEGLSTAISKVIQSPSLALERSQRGLETVASHLLLDRVIDKLERIYASRSSAIE